MHVVDLRSSHHLAGGGLHVKTPVLALFSQEGFLASSYNSTFHAAVNIISYT